MASIEFYAGSTNVAALTGSGLGFYGDAGFAASVSVGSYQGRTYITNSAGSAQGAEANNIKWLNSQSGVLGQTGSGLLLTAIPNYQATVEARFTHSSAVQVTNCKLYGYDRVSINNPPSGVTLKAAEIIHPDTVQTNNGSGDSTWTTLAGTGSYLSLAPSPGVSGFYAGNGANSTWTDTTHSHFLALSASPDTVGSKSFAVALLLEYL